MDGLSLAANIYAVIDAARKAAEGLRNISSIHHAPGEVLQFINEISDFRFVSVKVQEVIRKFDGSESVGPLNKFNASLDGVVERALGDIVEFNKILYGHIIMSSPNSAQNVKISRIQWFKRHRCMKRLVEGIHNAKVDINMSMTLLTASDLPQLQSTLSGIVINGKNLSTAMQRVDSNTVVQLSDIRPHIQSIKSSIRDINAFIPPSIHNVDRGTNYEFRTSIYATDNDKCSPACSCKCHISLTIQTPHVLSNLVGSLFLGYQGTPLLAHVPCNEHRCRRNDSCLLMVSYFFPSWFLRRMIFFKDKWTPTTDHMISVRTPRLVGTEGYALFHHSQSGNIEELRHLFVQGVNSPFDVDFLTGQGPLYFAVTRQQPDACEFLLSQYADPEAPCWSNTSPLDEVFNTIIISPNTPTSIAFKRIFASFLESSDSLQHRQFTALHKIVLKLSSIPLRSQLELSTAEIDAQCSQGKTALHYAIKTRDLESLKLLVEHGAHIDLPDSSGWNAIHHASDIFPAGLALLLDVASRIDATKPNFSKRLIEAKTSYGDTALIRACIQDHTGVSATLLLEHSADKNAFGDTGNPIHYCIQANNHSVLKILLEWDVDPNVKDSEGMGILHLAAAMGDIKTLEILYKADLRIQTSEDKDVYGHVPSDLFELDRPKIFNEDGEMRERCRDVFLRLSKQQRNRTAVVEEVLDSEDDSDDASSTHSSEDIFFDFNNAKE